MDTEQLPLVHRDASDSLQQQLSSYHERQRMRQQRHRFIGTMGRATVGFLAASLVTLLLVALSWPAQRNERSLELRTLLDAYQHDRNFSGVVRLSHNGQKKMHQAMGLANVPFEQPMEEHSVFPMGAHVQLLVSVAMYQLQEQGKVQLDHSVEKYWTEMDWQAFGKNQTTWCPHIKESVSCERMTFQHLLYMGSGIQGQHHEKLATLGQQIGSFIDVPLAFQPGTSYQFAEENYVLLMYMVERLSGLPFNVYLTKHVIQALGLKQTIFDPDHGALRVHRGLVDQYVQFYAHRSINTSQLDDMHSSRNSNTNGQKSHHISTGSCAMYQALDSSLHGLLSTGKDMHKIYTDLFHAHGQTSKLLKPESITQIVTTRNPTYRAFAQGIGVDFEDNVENSATNNHWPSKIAFCGTTACTTTCMAMQMPSVNLSIIASAFTNDVRLYFSSEDSFKAYKPRDFIDMRNLSMHDELFEKSDGEVNTLAWRLLQVFLQFYKTFDK
ncbi:Beta-lactamase/transpeptidase-like [Plasmopara halstedii]|uniref:Beta-lactamase/transpeptidase-like n=1 Tax=Plasmopara halstedii TaxID=4781 RepID=A0A0P1AZR5_PLAHL|nr:Beta-lactamase/transpeptidase-like [Plasmopara halstedii]CEG46433.1 Beta-lactamase/transpeptidase-like [Plasmopara halstedii]|eukprot:XP_024582802.1 Beta-lactamase/transpeptidase-like [Plasmopara halstedii]